MWPFKRSRPGTVTTTPSVATIDAIMSTYFDKKIIDALFNDSPRIVGDTVSWQRLELKKETETPMLLPKDILSELEVLKEERMNEHLTRIGVPGDQVTDQSAVLRALQQAQGMFNQGLGQGQQGASQFTNQQMMASSAWPPLQRRTW